jgi:predicted DCC family thiol-disulfide oxidoreductase YuxK
MGADFGENGPEAAGGVDAFWMQVWRLTGPWVLYDGTCPMCRRGEQIFGTRLRRRGFRLTTLQSAVGCHFAQGRCDEMKVVTREGRVIGGAEGMAYLCDRFWWTRMLAWAWRVPVARRWMEQGYRWIAAHRHCDGNACAVRGAL